MSIKKYISTILSKIRKKLRQNKTPIILGRVACLGHDLLALRNREQNDLINFQKLRIDYWLELIRGGGPAKSAVIIPFLAREDVSDLIRQQSDLSWLAPKKKPSYIIMDSFSELTDQRFTHRKEKWSFNCHYSDLRVDQNFLSEFECEGLLPISKIERHYRELFGWIKSAFPGTPVYFFHFPTKLDKRKKFAIRAKRILQVMKKLSIENNFIHNIAIAENLVAPAPSDSFPYHFARSTYEAFAREWDKVRETNNN